MLRLDYKKYGNQARKIKHDTIKWKHSIIPVTNHFGRVLKPHGCSHRLEYRLMDKVPPEIVTIINSKALSNRVEAAWYHSPNRNKQVEYFDKDVSVRIYPKSGTCRIHPRRILSFEELRVKLEDAFAKGLPATLLLHRSFKDMIAGLQVAHRHRTFHIGPITQFKNRFYRKSLGIDILADRSHPEHLEIHEYWPSWIPVLLESQRSQSLMIERNAKSVTEFAKQIDRHLQVMKGIGEAAVLLKEAAKDLGDKINLKSRSNEIMRFWNKKHLKSIVNGFFSSKKVDSVDIEYSI